MTHDTDPKPISKEWNYHPDLPLADLSIGDALLVVPLSVAWNSKDARVWLGLSGLAGELGADDLHRGRAALVLLCPARARQSAEIRSPRTGKR